jgi:RHS repeat-associated protein
VVNGNNFIFNFRFPGQYADQETGLFQNGYREYDPSTGRYMEVDPLGLKAGWNDYNYVESNSLNNADPMGLDDSVCMFNSALCGNGSFNPKTPPEMFSQPFPQPVVDFTGGWGDFVSMNTTKLARKFMGTDNQVKNCSLNYLYGEVAGFANSVLMSGYGFNVIAYRSGLLKTLYHFTSEEAYSNIMKNGLKMGENQLYGEGFYGTIINSKFWASISGAKSVEAQVILNVEFAQVFPTAWPGTFRILGKIAVK